MNTVKTLRTCPSKSQNNIQHVGKYPKYPTPPSHTLKTIFLHSIWQLATSNQINQVLQFTLWHLLSIKYITDIHFIKHIIHLVFFMSNVFCITYVGISSSYDVHLSLIHISVTPWLPNNTLVYVCVFVGIFFLYSASKVHCTILLGVVLIWLCFTREHSVKLEKINYDMRVGQ